MNFKLATLIDGNITQVLITLLRWYGTKTVIITICSYNIGANELEILGNLTGSIMDVSDPRTSWWTKCPTSS